MATTKYSHAPQSPHIGEMLQTRIKNRRISKAAVSRALNRKPITFHRFTKRASIQTEILWQICTVMKHNFFTDLATQLPNHFSNDAPIDRSKDDEIARLTEENKLLKAQLEAYEKVLSKNG